MEVVAQIVVAAFVGYLIKKIDDLEGLVDSLRIEVGQLRLLLPKRFSDRQNDGEP